MGIASYEAYCFDLDGTVYIGDRLLPGVTDTITELRRRGKRILFLTNSSNQTRRSCQQRLARMNVPASEEEVLTALYVSGQYFLQHEPEAKLLLMGDESMSEEMKQCGVAVTDDPKAATHVLVGMDFTFNYDKLNRGMKAIRSGARLAAVNPDPVCPVPGGYIPDTWALVKALETAGGVQAELVFGKPSPYFARQTLQRLSLAPEECLVVGDRLETDILLGVNSGMKTALVLTGVTDLEELERQVIKPDYVLNRLSDLLDVGGS